jgi:site-specific DNA-methyltransferase (adenine-specific)
MLISVTMRSMPGAPSPRNRSLRLTDEDRQLLAPALEKARAIGASAASIRAEEATDALILGDAIAALRRLPPASIDLLVADPPYNMEKAFGAARGRALSEQDYEEYTAKWVEAALPLLKPKASVYVCCDWRCSSAIQRVLARSLKLRNRITWEREKGRASSRNWKNSHEDIWFATVSESYHFDARAVMQRRLVRAPYRDEEGRPKDWDEGNGRRYRDTAASNLWTDLTVPFWSMPENTSHPTQKPEKLMAKLILASSRPGDLLLDPFLGSGASAVVARKLQRHYIGIEIDPEHCLAALRRLELAGADRRIQGYDTGIFWERNSAPRGN